MTKKHFQLLATTIRALELGQESKRYVARSFAETLKSTNTNFDAERFVSACLGEG